MANAVDTQTNATKTNTVVWFDLPVKDLKRAMAFYEKVLGAPLKEDFEGVASFPHGEGTVSGCLVRTDKAQPSTKGALIYLNVNGRLEDAIRQVRENGGKVEEDRHQIGEWGFRALVIDSEGNRVGLHSQR